MENSAADAIEATLRLLGRGNSPRAGEATVLADHPNDENSIANSIAESEKVKPATKPRENSASHGPTRFPRTR